MASLDDILTTAKNLVTAVNGVATTYLNVQGTTNAAAISAPTVVKASGGRVATVSVTTAGSAVGAIYDATTTSSPGRPVYTIPDTVGPVFVNLAMQYGIVVIPGTGQVVTVGFS
jgi:hypothetical protein